MKCGKAWCQREVYEGERLCAVHERQAERLSYRSDGGSQGNVYRRPGRPSDLPESVQAEIAARLHARQSQSAIARDLSVSVAQVRSVAERAGVVARKPSRTVGERPALPTYVPVPRYQRVTVEALACPHCGRPISLEKATVDET